MNGSVLQEDLNGKLPLVSKFVSSRAQLPVLSNILLAFTHGRLKLAATNLETGIVTSIGAKIEKEGKITVPAKVFSELINNLPAGKISLEVKGDQLNVTTSAFSGSFLGISASEFPDIPEKADTEDVNFSSTTIREISRKVVFSASTDDSRPVLTGLLFSIQKEMVIVATDGFRMSLLSINAQSKKQMENVLIPAVLIDELARLVGDEKDEVKVSIKKDDGQLIFESGDVVLTSRLLEGDFPDYKKVIPTEHSISITTDKSELARAVRAASVFARESVGVVKLKTEDGQIVLTSEDSQYGKEEVRVDSKIEGEKLTTAFNYKYLLDFLGSIDGDVVRIETNNSTSPVVFQDTKDDTYKHIIMPVRVQAE